MAAPVTMSLFDDLEPPPRQNPFASSTSPSRQPVARVAAAIVAGVCRVCGCKGDACTTDASGDKCAFVDPERTVCSGPGCVANYRPPAPAKPKTAPKNLPFIKRPCGCAVCSGRARGRCRQYSR